MTYETLKIKAQLKANASGRTTVVHETYSGYRVAFLTSKLFAKGGVQEIFEPFAGAGPGAMVAEYQLENGCDWSTALARCNCD